MVRPVPLRHLIAAVLVVVLLIPVTLAAEPTRAERQPDRGFVAQAWTFLMSLWSDNGPGLDPDGAQTDAGPGLDPSGLTADGDNGSILDPSGRP
jgi:hypothetical protein